LKVLEIIERDGLLESARSLGEYLASSLRALANLHITEIRAIGLMIGVQLSGHFPKSTRPPALEVVTRAMSAGLLVIPAGETVVRFLPPLNVTRQEIDEGVAIFSETLLTFESSN
jgi:4-aminobutyrate aminotransferase-like enzyme